jgi:hypothetical protein
LRHGELGERAAKKFLQKCGLKFLAANFRSARGEIELIFRDGDCLAFEEVKTRSSEDWGAARRRREGGAATAIVAGGVGLSETAEKSGGENPVRHRGSFAGRR